MKILLLITLLFSLNANAYKRAEIIKMGKVLYQKEAITQAEIDQWIMDNESNNSWGSKASYSINHTDITSEINAIEAEKQARLTELQQIRAMVTNIEESGLPLWHKKLLKRLIKELRD